MIPKRIVIALFAAAIPAAAQLHDVGRSFVQTYRGWEEKVDNFSRVPIVAYHSSFRCPARTGGSVAITQYSHDALVGYGYDKPIAPGGSTSSVISAGLVNCPGGVDAVIFSDGHGEGDPDVLRGMLATRRGVLVGLAMVLPWVDNVGNIGMDPETAATEIAAKSNSLSGGRGEKAKEWQGEKLVLDSVARFLREQIELYIPSDASSHREETVDMVQHEKHVSRQQAHAIVLGRKLREWSADLASVTSVPAGTQ